MMNGYNKKYGAKMNKEDKKADTIKGAKRYEELSRKHNLQIGKLSIKCLDAFSRGVAYEINRQTRLEF